MYDTKLIVLGIVLVLAVLYTSSLLLSSTSSSLFSAHGEGSSSLDVDDDMDDEGVGRSFRNVAKPSRSCRRGALDWDLEQARRIMQNNLRNRLKRLGGYIPEYPYKGWGIRPVKEVFFVPVYNCVYQERFGRWGEGGKWACPHPRILPRKPVIYSVGSKGDISFEKAIAALMKVKVRTMDPFLEWDKVQKVMNDTSVDFHAIGLSGRQDLGKYRAKSPEKSFMTVEEMLKKFGDKFVDILKMDCEGCEVEVVNDLVDRFGPESVPFNQVLVEVHNALNGTMSLDFTLKMERLGFRLFHVEENAWCKYCYELAYLHESFISGKPRKKKSQ